MILVTGASGNVGRAVMDQLRKTGADVRGLYRSAQDAAKAPSGVQTAVADFADSASLDAALGGIEKVFLVCSPIPDLVELESKAIEACRRHAIGHLVLNSSFGAGQYDKSFPSWHASVEQRLKASGLPFTIVRPESFMQNIVQYYAGTIRSERAFYAAGGNRPIAFIDMRDIAACMAAILTQDGHAGAMYTLTGSEALTYADVAARISKLLGTTVTYVDLPPQQMMQAMLELGMPAWQAQAILDLQAFYTEGPGASVSGDVRRLLGRDPILFDQFLKDNAESFRADSHKETA